MRSFLFTVAAIFLLAGVVALTRPRVSLFSPTHFRPKPIETDVLSKESSAAYGFVSIGFGATALWCALAWRKWNDEERAD